MRIDVISIFPDYLAPLALSLPGKARDKGLLDLTVHDLRQWAHDRHHTVDDTPYGGGAGMVMKPEPWGEALDAVTTPTSTLLVPTPSGRPLTQALAAELATREHLVFACGRYEGIDQRVIDEAGAQMEVIEVSLGDYVLNGGEVAALVVIEAVVRLLPGFMGNAESLTEESHTDGLLEYPVYTKPASWRGHDVPAVLLSGDHGRIAAWRHAESVRRTAERRPDLLHASQAVGLDADGPTWHIEPATRGDAGELLTLQRACWVQEQVANPGVEISALTESLEQVHEWLATWQVYVVREGGRLIGAVRGRLEGAAPDQFWDIGRIMVAPDLQGRGLGRALLGHIEAVAPRQATRFVLFTGVGSSRNQRIYRKAGYRPSNDPVPSGAVALAKRRH